VKVLRLVTAAAVTTTLLSLTAPLTASAAPAHHGPDDRPLRQLAADDGVRVGTAVDMSALASDAPYRALTGQQFNTVTAENVMKWESLEPQRGVTDYAAADRLVDYATRHGQKIRGHVLVWHSQLPSWLNENDFTSAELRDILHQHITDTVKHFRGRIWQWDVVNEAFNDDGTLRDTIWLRKLGPGYIADAFRWAHRADPRAKLFYNDYNLEFTGPKSNAVLDMVKGLQRDGVPVDGVGFQGHLALQFGLPTDMPDVMKRFSDLGLYTAVTEADVRMILPADDAKLADQARGYTLMLNSCLNTRGCLSFTVWGFSDKYQWVPGVFTGQGAAAVYDEDFRPKPAYRALQTALAGYRGAHHGTAAGAAS
jgi:endo-1,4-beta-xylanase